VLHRCGYADGLPIVPSTDGLVREMLSAQLRPAGEVLEMPAWLRKRADSDHSLWDRRGVLLADCAADNIVLVAGGRERHSGYIPSTGADKTAGVAR
jgi:hypothetical protein